jgi:hypothetical protein
MTWFELDEMPPEYLCEPEPEGLGQLAAITAKLDAYEAKHGFG